MALVVQGDRMREREPKTFLPKEKSYRQCIECDYHPVERGKNCPNCGRNYIGEEGAIPNADIPSVRGRQYERDLPDLDLEV